MRQIEAMIETIIEFLFRKEGESEAEPSEAATRAETELKAKLDGYLSAGKLCEAEDWLYENMDDSDEMWLRLALRLYSEMNKLSDGYLEENDFSREEILSGLAEVCRRFGYGPLLGI